MDTVNSTAPDAAGDSPSGGTLDRRQANLLEGGDRLRVRREGLLRHDLHEETEALEGTYVSQFDSPRHGRLVVVHLPGRGNYGFRLDELERMQGDGVAG